MASSTRDLEGRGDPRKGWLPGEAASSRSRMLLDGNFTYPVAVLLEDALAHNIATMADYCRHGRLLLAPHAKTTMAPAVLRRQLEAGAWALTVATWTQARRCWSLGFRRLLIANELVGRAEVAWVARQVVETTDGELLLSFVDDEATVARVDAFADAHAPGSVMDVFVEVGYAGGRCGCRSTADAVRVGEAVNASRHLRLIGVAGYEGLIAKDCQPHSLAAVDAFLAQIADAARALADRGLFGERPPLLSAGGSAFFDRVAAILEPVAAGLGGRLLLRCGCYVTHDHGLYARLGAAERAGIEPFRAALQIWGAVLSRPERARAIVGVGKRDVAFDTDLPQPLGQIARDGEFCSFVGAQTLSLDDQHAHLRLEESCDLRPGDLVGFGVSHPCAAFDRWSTVVLVDSDYRLIEPFDTYF